MSLRSLIYDHITSDQELMNLLPAERWIAASAARDDNRPFDDGQFVIIRYGVATRGMGAMKRFSGEFWVHDEPGSYDHINGVIGALQARLDGTVHLMDSENELMSADWVSDSGDLYDPGFRTIARTTTYNLIGQGV